MADPIVLAQQLCAISQRISLIVYEAGPTGYCLERVLKVNGYKVAVVAPSRIPRPVTNQAKTDKLDCLKLAEYAAKGMIEAITTPTEQEGAERNVLRRRNQLVDSTRKTKQRIKSFLLFHGIEEVYGLRYWNRSARAELSKLPLQSDLKFVLKSLLRQLSYEEEELARITNRLARIAKRSQHWEVVKNLKTVPGVGDIFKLFLEKGDKTSFFLEDFVDFLMHDYGSKDISIRKIDLSQAHTIAEVIIKRALQRQVIKIKGIGQISEQYELNSPIADNQHVTEPL